MKKFKLILKESSITTEQSFKQRKEILNDPKFKKWFAGSKIVDDKGQPLVLYHGSKTSFSTFKPSESGKYGPGIYMTYNPKYTENFSIKGTSSATGDSPQTFALYAKIVNPLVITDEIDDKAYAEMEKKINMSREDERFPHDDVGALIGAMAKKGGCDGLIFNHPRMSEIIAFNANQVKSAFASGYSLENPDITKE